MISITISFLLHALFSGKCDSSSIFVCLDYNAISLGRIVSVEASPSANAAAYPPESALGGQTMPGFYQAESSLVDVFYRINIEPSMSLKVTTFEFNSVNVDQISVTLSKNFVPSLHNQVGYNGCGLFNFELYM